MAPVYFKFVNETIPNTLDVSELGVRAPDAAVVEQSKVINADKEPAELLIAFPYESINRRDGWPGNATPATPGPDGWDVNDIEEICAVVIVSFEEEHAVDIPEAKTFL